MRLAEDVARNCVHEQIGLHVFAKNEAAIALYVGLGYRVDSADSTSQRMVKDLAQHG